MTLQKSKSKANSAAKPRAHSPKKRARSGRVPGRKPAGDLGFFSSPTIEQLAAAQGVVPLKDPAELAGGWPADEDVDVFLKVTRRGRN